MSRKFTFKKTVELTGNLNCKDDNEQQKKTPALISSLTAAQNTVTISAKKQPPPNIFQQQSISSSNTTSLPFKKQIPNAAHPQNNTNLIIDSPIIDKFSSKENIKSNSVSSPHVSNKPNKQVTLNRFFELKQSSPANLNKTNENSAKKPTATVVPQKQIESSNKINSVKTSLFANQFIDKPKPTSKTTTDIAVNKDKSVSPKKSIDDPTKCNSCQTLYDSNPKSKSMNRKIIDNCGHAICFACLMDNKACTICESVNKTKINESKLDETGSTLSALIETEDLDRSEIIEKKPEPVKSCSTKNDSFDLKDVLDDEEIDDLIEIKPLTTKLNKPKTKSPPKSASNRDTIYLDSDGESGVVLVKSDDEFYSSIPIIKDKPVRKTTVTKPQNNVNDLFDDEEEEIVVKPSKSTIASKSKDEFNDNDDDDDDFNIEDVDFGELPKPKTVPIIRQNSHISVSNKPDSNLNSSTITNINNNKQIDSNDKLENKHGVVIPELSQYPIIKWLFNDIKDSSPHYHRLDYEHSNDMLITFRNLFGLRQFRPQQFDAVNAALTGTNCFVLMPTGGGKSLCYQLPACINRGVTLVVSPLKSLIIDQVDKLNSLNITAAHLLADKEDDDNTNSNFVYQDLSRQEPTLKLLYLTPEKLNLSGKLTKILTSLYNRNMIARLVIDEAHCVSNWGHDFRKDYTQLGALRNRLFPNVPVMLLTATATPRVRKDILIQMGLSCNEKLFNNNPSNPILATNSKLHDKLANRNYVMSSGLNTMNGAQRQNCAFFIQSFNRENLQYKVEYKTSNAAALEKIVTIIKQKYLNKSGIVYCISRNECETVSDYLRKNGLKSLPYHAGMNDKQRQSVQHKWSNNIDCKVVCATIAFGMGIDKADVRYVFHLGLPKSLEGYYQESGRAGRDGQVSLCYLFFNNHDRQKWLGLMKREQQASRGDYEVFKVHVDNLYRMSQYCDNNTDCRRAQILEYFGEIFDRKKCIESKMNTACDNCLTLKANAFTLRDITAEAISICRGVQQIGVKDDVTLLHLSEILKGSKNAKVTEKSHHKLEMHGKLTGYKKNDIERILRRLIFMGYLSEEVKVITYTDTVACYIKLGPKANLLTRDKVTEKIEFDFIGSEATKSRYTFDNNLDDEEDEYFGNDEEDTEMNKTSKTKAKESTKEKSLKTRCATELKALAKEVCSQSHGQKVETIFPRKLLNEMLDKMPTTKQAFLKLEYYTEAKFNNYQGERFLTIFNHYASLLDELKEEELMAKAIEAEQAAIASSKIKSKEYAPSDNFTKASLKNSKSYGLLDDGDMISNNTYGYQQSSAGTNSKWQNASQYKRKSTSNFVKNSFSKSKKAKTSHTNDDDNSSFSTSSYPSSSNSKYTKKKPYNAFAKKWKFKKKT